jgi:hypothetical protein
MPQSNSIARWVRAAEKLLPVSRYSFADSRRGPAETAAVQPSNASSSVTGNLDRHDHLLAAGVVPTAPYNLRNTTAPKDIKYRVEDRIKEHSEDVQLKQSTLDETYNRRTGVERANESVKDCGLRRAFARGRVYARAQVCQI